MAISWCCNLFRPKLLLEQYIDAEKASEHSQDIDHTPPKVLYMPERNYQARINPLQSPRNIERKVEVEKHTEDFREMREVEPVHVLPMKDLQEFEFKDLRKATRNFLQPDMVLGRGGFGTVYRGWLKDPVSEEKFSVAVKRLDPESGLQGEKEWMTEIVKLGRLQHEHVIEIIGFCAHEGEAILVYEYMANGSLDYHLFRGDAQVPPISWRNRIKVARHMASALAYLHHHKIIHRDFKTANVLLDKEFNAKITDFGLARDAPEHKTHITATKILGTLGYLDPKYFVTGELNVKTDIFSFGVVLFELLIGRRVVDVRRLKMQTLVEWARESLENSEMNFHPRLDSRIAAEMSSKEERKRSNAMALKALACIDEDPKRRPSARDLKDFFDSL